MNNTSPGSASLHSAFQSLRDVCSVRVYSFFTGPTRNLFGGLARRMSVGFLQCGFVWKCRGLAKRLALFSSLKFEKQNAMALNV